MRRRGPEGAALGRPAAPRLRAREGGRPFPARSGVFKGLCSFFPPTRLDGAGSARGVWTPREAPRASLRRAG